jgi:hypothetical protein
MHADFMRVSLLLLLLLLAAVTPSAEAQDFYIYAEDEYSIRNVRFTGNQSYSNARLQDVVQTSQSPSRFSSWINTRISNKIGNPPEYFDIYRVAEDIERIRFFYENHGFFAVAVDTALSINSDRQQVGLTFLVEEGPRWTIEEIEYNGLEGIDSLAYHRIRQRPEITTGIPYQLDMLEREYQRILDILYNSGYAKASIENVDVRYSQREQAAFISMSFRPDERFTFGPIRINIEEDRGYHISPSIVYRMLEYRENEIYSLANRTRSERNLNRLGIFESAKIDIRIPTADDTTRSIPSVVNFRPRSKHEITPEILVNDENNAFNIGLGIGYANRNFMGGARILNIRSRFRIQSIQELQLVRVLNENGWRDPSLLGAIDVGAEVTQPYIFTTQTSGRWGGRLDAGAGCSPVHGGGGCPEAVHTAAAVQLGSLVHVAVGPDRRCVCADGGDFFIRFRSRREDCFRYSLDIWASSFPIRNI